MGKRTCPICQKKFDKSTALPFCAPKCQQVDLYKWLNQDYAIPTNEPVGIIQHDDDEHNNYN